MIELKRGDNLLLPADHEFIEVTAHNDNGTRLIVIEKPKPRRCSCGRAPAKVDRFCSQCGALL